GTALSQIMGFDNHMITTESRACLHQHDFAGTLPCPGGTSQFQSIGHHLRKQAVRRSVDNSRQMTSQSRTCGWTVAARPEIS
ncbi:hypothetical protein, partial [Amycolatopsis plumensis]